MLPAFHSTETLRQHRLLGWNTVENSCGFWIEWLDQAGIQQEELEKGKIETLSFFAFYIISVPTLFLGGRQNTEALAYHVDIENVQGCWDNHLAFKLDHVHVLSADWRDHQPFSFAPPVCFISTHLFKYDFLGFPYPSPSQWQSILPKLRWTVTSSSQSFGFQGGNHTPTQTLSSFLHLPPGSSGRSGPVWGLHSAPHCTGHPCWPVPLMVTDPVTLS